MEKTPAVGRGQWLAIGLIVVSMGLGFVSDGAALKIVADLLIGVAAVVMVTSLVIAWRASRRRRRAVR